MHCKAKGECRGRILLHGGNDSYIEEFYPMLRYFQETGYDVYLFEGAGRRFARAEYEVRSGVGETGEGSTGSF